jgi:hypothetical protein
MFAPVTDRAIFDGSFFTFVFKTVIFQLNQQYFFNRTWELKIIALNIFTLTLLYSKIFTIS